MIGTFQRISTFWAAPPHPVGTPGYQLPSISDFERFPFGAHGADNWVLARKDNDWRGKLTIKCAPNVSGNMVVYGDGSLASGAIEFGGSNNTLICGEANPYHFNCTLYFSGEQGLIFLGARSTCNQVTAWTHGHGTSVIFGEDVMIAHAVLVRTSDDHALVDINTGLHLNPPESVHVSPHVWLCPEVHLLKGSRIGYGSIIGERSIVSSTIERYVMAAGVPARPLRTGVTWDRPLFPRPGIHDHYVSLGAIVSL